MTESEETYVEALKLQIRILERLLRDRVNLPPHFMSGGEDD